MHGLTQAHERQQQKKPPDILEEGRSFSATWVLDFTQTTWRAASGAGEIRKPLIHLEILQVDTSRLEAAEASLNRDTNHWLRAALVDHDGLPWRQEWASRKQLQRGLFLVPYENSVEEPRLGIMPMDREIITTPSPIPSSIRFAELQMLVRQHVASCHVHDHHDDHGGSVLRAMLRVSQGELSPI